MSFAQKVMKKYGWKEGQGLGKQSEGIKEAIKPQLKANNFGIGFKAGAEFQDNWWENVFNQAASNINVEGDENGVACSVSEASNDVEYLPHKKKKSKSSIKEKYSLFQPNNHDVCSDVEVLANPEEVDLLKKCGGRTVHKGARHGLTLSGKLGRLERHEQESLHTLDTSDFKIKKKKKKKSLSLRCLL